MRERRGVSGLWPQIMIQFLPKLQACHTSNQKLYFKEKIAMSFVKVTLGLIILACLTSTGMSASPVIAAVSRTVGKASRIMDIARRPINANLINQYVGGTSTGITFDNLREGVQWFKKMKDAIKGTKPLSGSAKKASHSRLFDEIYVCKPDYNPKKKCYSRCEKKGEKYRWCYSSSEHRDGEWEVCSCRLKNVIVEYLEFEKGRLLVTPPKPWTSVEIGFATATIVLSLVLVIIAIVWAVRVYQRRQNQFQLPLPENAGQFAFHLNPAYQPPVEANQEAAQG